MNVEEVLKESKIYKNILNGSSSGGSNEPPLTVLTLEEFFKRDISPREMIMAPWLSSQGLTMVYSIRGVGKTFFATAVGYTVATGSIYLKWTAPKPRRVLYIDGELPAVVLRDRLLSLVRSFEVEPPSPDYFRVMTPDFQSDLGIPNLATREGQKALEPHLAGVELLILDNLSTLCRGGEENSAESWLPIQEWTLSLRKKGLSILMVHHAGKGGQQRGTSRREDVLDTVISLKRPKDYRPEDGAKFEVHFEKARGLHGKGAEPFLAQLDTIDGKLCWTMQEMEDVLLQKIVGLSQEGLSQRQIAVETEKSLGTINRLLKQGKEKGLLR